MRVQFCEAMMVHGKNPSVSFFTGDLGFMALEGVQNAMGERFINAGIAEQNMVSVAAAMAKQGFETWVYTIAPFCYARAFEQIRNDVCFNNLPVKLVGNGGGYGYGVMGPTHHAIEDYGTLLTLPNMRVIAPVFDEDLQSCVHAASEADGPIYLRLGKGELPSGFEAQVYQPWRKLVSGEGAVVVSIGALAGHYMASLISLPAESRPNLWAISELPIDIHTVPDELLEQITKCKTLIIAEEHVAHGGLASEIALLLVKERIVPEMLHHLFAKSHVYDDYGSQNHLRQKSNLTSNALLSLISS